MASEKQDDTSNFNESRFESYWQFMARIESLNKLSVTKKPLGNKTCNHGRIRENPWKILLKSHQKI